MSTLTGITYRVTGQESRGRVSDYHRKPSPLKLNKTQYRVDIAALKKAEQRTAIKIDGAEFESKFTIGFEIEKNQLSRGAVKEYELFCGFERDGSCGYEAVTHILPLLPAGQWRTKVFDMIHKAERIIDDRFSPSDKRCGGHITIGVDGMTGDQIREKIRGNCGIILAMFRQRLTNSYCGANRRMEQERDYGAATYQSHTGSGAYDRYGWHRKYQAVLVKGDVIEFRLPSKFESVRQTMRRYELFYEILAFSLNTPKASHETLLARIRPIVLSMYNGDTDKADRITELARHFRSFILDGTISNEIQGFL